jgi:SNF2 family DNA or RNA helicase
LTFEPRVKVGHIREDVGQEEVEQRPELAAQAKVDDEASNKVVKQLHAVLRPFLLRRVKMDAVASAASALIAASEVSP